MIDEKLTNEFLNIVEENKKKIDLQSQSHLLRFHH